MHLIRERLRVMLSKFFEVPIVNQRELFEKISFEKKQGFYKRHMQNFSGTLDVLSNVNAWYAMAMAMAMAMFMVYIVMSANKMV